MTKKVKEDELYSRGIAMAPAHGEGLRALRAQLRCERLLDSQARKTHRPRHRLLW